MAAAVPRNELESSESLSSGLASDRDKLLTCFVKDGAAAGGVSTECWLLLVSAEADARSASDKSFILSFSCCPACSSIVSGCRCRGVVGRRRSVRSVHSRRGRALVVVVLRAGIRQVAWSDCKSVEKSKDLVAFLFCSCLSFSGNETAFFCLQFDRPAARTLRSLDQRPPKSNPHTHTRCFVRVSISLPRSQVLVSREDSKCRMELTFVVSPSSCFRLRSLLALEPLLDTQTRESGPNSFRIIFCVLA